MTVEELRKLDVNQIVALIEQHAGQKLPLQITLELAILLGAGEAGVMVFDPGPGGAAPYTQRLNYDALAALVNEGNRA